MSNRMAVFRSLAVLGNYIVSVCFTRVATPRSLLGICHITHKNLTDVRSMAVKCLFDCAAHQVGTLSIKGIVLLRQLCKRAVCATWALFSPPFFPLN